VEISHLWQSLDTDSDGKVRMEELCSPRAEVLAKFKEWSRQKFGTSMALWETPEAVRARARWRGQGLWISDTKMLIPAFGEALRELEWPGIHCQEERSYVFSSLDSMGCNLITPEDLAWLDRWIPSEFLAADPSPTAWADLKEILVKTYQHPLRAWRILDRDNSNRIAWTEFRDVCKKVHFTGDIVGAWRMLDTDMSGYISMREYDPSSEELLTSFKEWADSNFGSVRHCFKALDSDRSGSVTYAELKRACHKMKWMGNVRTLFDCLDLDSADRRNRDAATGKRAISLEEIAFLDTWHVEPRPELAKFEDQLAQLEASRLLTRERLLQEKTLLRRVQKGRSHDSSRRPQTGPAATPQSNSSLPACEDLPRPHSQGDLRRPRHGGNSVSKDFSGRRRPKTRQDFRDCRPQTDNSWLRSYTSFRAVGVHR